MPYTQKTLDDIYHSFDKSITDIEKLTLTFARYSEGLKPLAKEYLMHGVCRRLQILSHTLKKIFLVFPPNHQVVLSTEHLLDVQTYLHAFVMNLYGLLDNSAWVYIHQHEIKDRIGSLRDIGLFQPKTIQYLPAQLKEYLTRADAKKWYEEYVRNYRHALAHRIPIYIPPYILREKDMERYRELDDAIMDCIYQQDFDRRDVLEKERNALCCVSDTFMHSFSDKESKPIHLHAQLISDGLTIIEIGKIFSECMFLPPEFQ